jgi:CheY-like chemotaxis protein
MNGVLGMAQLLLDAERDPDKLRQLGTLRDSGQALLAIIDEILDFSKIEAGKVEVESIDFDVRAVVDKVVHLTRTSLRDKDVAVDVEVAPDVPRWIRSDPARLRQILTNLTSNAAKFTDAGRVVMRVARPTSAHLRFEVTDTGIGIAAGERERLLEPFSQADASTTRRFGGTGLGLAISRQLVSLLGGTLDYESEPGAGSTFWFDIPLSAADAPIAAPEQPAGGGAVASPVTAGSGGRVLLAEDSAVNRMVASAMLERLGYTVDVAINGVEAVEAARTTRYDAILMDCLMPHLDGYGATARIRELDEPARSVRIIAVTASAMSGDRDKCLAAGMDDYLTKPIALDALADALSRVPAHGAAR